MLARVLYTKPALVLNPFLTVATTQLLLGHLISADGVRPDPSKMSSILNAPFPQTRKDMHHWVGLANYYAAHVKDFALIAVPLHDFIHSKPVKGKK